MVWELSITFLLAQKSDFSVLSVMMVALPLRWAPWLTQEQLAASGNVKCGQLLAPAPKRRAITAEMMLE